METMNKYFDALEEYDEWEHELSQKAKATAHEWYKDFTESNIAFVEWKSGWSIRIFRYVLTKVATILYHLGIIVDWDTTGDIEVDEEDETMLVAGVFLVSRSGCASPLESDEESESDSDDPVAEK